MHEGITSTIIGEATVTPWLPRSKRSKARWSDVELDVLREHYPTGGLAACQDRLPKRHDASIYQKAQSLDLKAPGQPGFREKWTSTTFIDEAIRQAYATNPKRGVTQRLGKQLHRPPRWISHRVRQLGIAPPRFHEPPWKEEETALLLTHASKQPMTIQGILKRHSFKRSTGAIAVRLRKLRADRTDHDHYSGNGLAALMGVDHRRVKTWIDKGWLIARRKSGLGGSEFLIHRRSVRRFIIDNVGAVDIRRVDKFWLVDLLAGRAEA